MGLCQKCSAIGCCVGNLYVFTNIGHLLPFWVCIICEVPFRTSRRKCWGLCLLVTVTLRFLCSIIVWILGLGPADPLILSVHYDIWVIVYSCMFKMIQRSSGMVDCLKDELWDTLNWMNVLELYMWLSFCASST